MTKPKGVSNRWTKADVQVLIEKFPTTPVREIAAELNAPLYRVYQKAEVLGLCKQNWPRAWTMEDLEYVKQHFPTTRATEIAQHLRRSTQAVKHVARKLGLKQPIVRNLMARAWARPKGPASHLWKGGISTEYNRMRHSTAYTTWRTAVFQRDDYTCVLCGNRGGRLNADHTKPFAHFPKLRFDVSNGRTLCEACHRTTNTFGGRTAHRHYEKTG